MARSDPIAGDNFPITTLDRQCGRHIDDCRHTFSPRASILQRSGKMIVELEELAGVISLDPVTDSVKKRGVLLPLSKVIRHHYPRTHSHGARTGSWRRTTF
ncbi:hypothetical protein [Tardibacter chloracetimidivorans]|uniref:hypothetical protein n=1 Tax=Tardibacter chloracetimidivorans TaxID=1921510 RepID=UPI0013011E74|nr:hypothetical protein [Tardibacter chloracetimidivorans]